MTDNEPRIVHVSDDFMPSAKSLAKFHSDTVLCGRDEEWRFADELPAAPWHTMHTITVSLARCRRHKDPLEALKLLTIGRTVEFTLDPSSESTQRHFPTVNPQWRAVRVLALAERVVESQFIRVSFFDEDTIDTTISLNCLSWHDLADLRFEVASVPFAVFYLELITGEELDPETSYFIESAVEKAYSYHTLSVHGGKAVFLAHGSYYTALKLQNRLGHFGRCCVTPPDHDFTLNVQHRNDSSPYIEKSPFDEGSLPLTWCKSEAVYRRRRRYHDTILGVALCLSHIFPPYVLLEIIDWLPYLYLYPHRYKIHLLESIRASIVRAKRLSEE